MMSILFLSLRRLRRKCKLSVGKPTSLWLSSSMANITQRYALKKLEFAAKIVGFKDIELQKFEGGWLSEEDMSEWREEMREMINRIDDEDLKAAFQKAAERIWTAYKERGGGFPPYYVMRMRK